MQKILKTLLAGDPLDRAEAKRAMGLLMDLKATPAQTGAFLAALRVRGEGFMEIAGMAEALRERALKVKVSRKPLLDTCGTGGDGSGTFNISTTVAFIAAGAGAAVAKHGNRSVSSRCGSADVLEALGVKTDLAPEGSARCVDEVGLGFLFAPNLHPAMKNVGPIRKELGVRTVFNLLGPLSNPAGAKRQLLGVYATGLVPVMAQVLKELGSDEAIVVSSKDGLDEFSLGAPNVVAHLRQGIVANYEFDAPSLGLARCRVEDLAGGDAAENAEITLSILKGDKGPRRDVSLLNGAAAITAAGICKDIKEGLGFAADSIDSGKALNILEELKTASHKYG